MKNIIFQILFKIMAVALSILTLRWFNDPTIIPKTLADEYSKILAINTLLCGFLAFGLSNIVYKVFTNSKDSQAHSDAIFTTNVLRLGSLFFGILLVIIIYFLNNVFGWGVQYFRLTNLLFFFGLFTSQFLLFWDTHYRAVADSTGKSWLYSISDFIFKGFYVALLYILINFFTRSVENSILVITLAGLIANFTLIFVDTFIFTRKLPKPRFNFGLVTKNLSLIKHISVISIFIGLIGKIDAVVLAGGDGYVRGYSAAYQVYETILIVPVIVSPVLAAMVFKNKIKLKSMLIISPLIGLCLYLVSIFASKILLDITNATTNYPLSVQVIGILMLCLIPSLYNNFLYNVNTASGNEKTESYAIIGSGVISIVLYLIFIPIYGAFGAAWVTFFNVCLESIIKSAIFFRSKSWKNSHLNG